MVFLNSVSPVRSNRILDIPVTGERETANLVMQHLYNIRVPPFAFPPPLYVAS